MIWSNTNVSTWKVLLIHFNNRATIARTARPRWLISFFSSGAISAKVQE